MTTFEPATHLPAPIAARLRRPSWKDPRLLFGLVLVAASVVLGASVVSAARGTTPVYVAGKDFAPGDTIAASDLRVVDLNLGDASARYVTPAAPLRAGAVATTVVHQGELVPTASVGAAADVDLRAVSVPVDGTLSDRVRTGTAVDLWFVPRSTGATTGAEDSVATPRQIASRAIVEKVDKPDKGLVVGGSTTVHVLVTAKDLPAVLGALDGEGAVTVVAGAGK
jgi:hypothetical protein